MSEMTDEEKEIYESIYNRAKKKIDTSDVPGLEEYARYIAKSIADIDTDMSVSEQSEYLSDILRKSMALISVITDQIEDMIEATAGNGPKKHSDTEMAHFSARDLIEKVNEFGPTNTLRILSSQYLSMCDTVRITMGEMARVSDISKEKQHTSDINSDTVKKRYNIK